MSLDENLGTVGGRREGGEFETEAGRERREEEEEEETSDEKGVSR